MFFTAERFARAARIFALAAVAVSVASTLAFAIGLLNVRPLGYGEAEPLYEASRLRAGLPLYVDPLVGAFDYGPVPTRCFVVYPPLWSWVLSHLGAGHAAIFARTACSMAWFGTLAWIAFGARQEGRKAAWLAASLAAGVFVLALWGTSGRPDSVAIALAAVSLQRAARRGEPDGWTGACVALAAWTKPNVLGIAVGLTAFALSSRSHDALASQVARSRSARRWSRCFTSPARANGGTTW